MARERKPSQINNRYKDDWLKRLYSEDKDGDEVYYPEETKDTPPVSPPDKIEKRRVDINRIQEELQGHLYIPYYHLPPYRARFFDVVDRRSLAAATSTDIISTTIPWSNAVLRWFGNDIEEAAGFGNITWYVQINGTRYDPWNAITRQIGTIPLPTPVFVNMKEGDVAIVNITNASATTAYTVLTRIKGWFW